MLKGKAFRIDYDDNFGSNTLDWKSPARGSKSCQGDDEDEVTAQETKESNKTMSA